jgi:hypothetical protein
MTKNLPKGDLQKRIELSSISYGSTEVADSLLRRTMFLSSLDMSYRVPLCKVSETRTG